MCGIVGTVGASDAAAIILSGLQRLEYRGYDSAGIAVYNANTPQNPLQIRRAVGKLSHLAAKIDADPLAGQIGIGHTRWATHGAPTERNAHPHVSQSGAYVVVHNGIVENYQELRDELLAEGIQFQSDTDTEVIAQLVELYAAINGGDVIEATRAAVKRLRGAQAIGVMSQLQPDRLVIVRIGNAGGVVVGIGDGAHYIASDVPAILDYTREVVFLESRQMAVIWADRFTIQTLDGEMLNPTPQTLPYDAVSVDKGAFQHFMLKEIFEQGRSITDTLRGRVDFDQLTVTLPELQLTPEIAQRLNRLVIVACGTSYYSGLVGKALIERLARLHVEVDYGSEYRYRSPVIDANTAFLAITQSGETVDTLSGMETAREHQATVWSIVNAPGSQAMRLADGYITMNAGAEISVASTKVFTASIVDQYLLALRLAALRQTLSPDELKAHTRDLARLPQLIDDVLAQAPLIEALAAKLCHFTNFLYLGRGINYPIALEGALKLKEISYIHAEGYPAGEMKHGPIALIDDQMPVVAITLKDSLYEKMISQVEQAKARDGVVIAIATEGDTDIQTKADYVIYLPPVPELLSPVISTIPLQLLAYYIAVLRGTDIDQPRNLAKSVTVE